MKISLHNFDWDKISYFLMDELNKLAKKLNADYKDISEVLNVDQANIHKVLNKKRKLTFKTFIRICLALAEINKMKGGILPEEDFMPSTLLKKAGL